MNPSRTRPASHPALAHHAEARAQSAQNRIADTITSFAGSMVFVYLHIAWFIVWLVFEPFGDNFPFGLLTMLVSLEAIFLSTFVMISQNRADQKREVLAAHQWEIVQVEETQNEELLGISKQLLDVTNAVHELTKDVHRAVNASGGAAAAPE